MPRQQCDHSKIVGCIIGDVLNREQGQHGNPRIAGHKEAPRASIGQRFSNSVQNEADESVQNENVKIAN